MKNMLTIYRREFAAYFNSPIAYIFMCVFLIALSLIFFGYVRFFSTPAPDIGTFFQIVPFVLPFLIPPVTMRLWSEERRTGTIEILMTLPLRSWEIVLGKYLAGMTVISVAFLLSLAIPISVSWVATVDWGVVLSSYIGALVISSVYVAGGAWISTWTQNQIIALLISGGSCFLAYLLSSQHVTTFFNDFVFGSGRFVTWFGTWPHYQEFAKGLVHPVGFIYGASLTVFFLILNNLFVEGRKF